MDRPARIASAASSTRRASIDDSLTSGQILPDRDLSVSETAKQARDGSRLPVASLEHKCAPRGQARHRLLRNRLGRAGGDERLAWLVLSDFRLEPVELVVLDVRRV